MALKFATQNLSQHIFYFLLLALAHFCNISLNTLAPDLILLLLL